MSLCSLSQIIVDGRIGEKSIALILTGADVCETVFCNDRLTDSLSKIPFDEKGAEVDLASVSAQ